MQKMTFKGRIVKVGPVVENESNGKTYTKRELWVEEDADQYPATASFEFGGERINRLSLLQKGMDVQVEFTLGGRTYTDKATGELKVFNKLTGWDVVPLSMYATPQVTQPAPQAKAKQEPPKFDKPVPASMPQAPDTDDLPF